ncbi:MAG: hypothetical protein ACE5NP_09715 [Anaerolineae bacterium]
MDEGRSRVIRASEIAQYTYCARAWWLKRVKGYESAHVEALATGQAAHKAHGGAVEWYHRLRWIAYGLLLAALGVGALWLCLISGVFGG